MLDRRAHDAALDAPDVVLMDAGVEAHALLRETARLSDPADRRAEGTASGNGSNAEEIIKHFKDHPAAEVVLVLSNKADAFVLTRAYRNNIESRVFDRVTYRDSTDVLEWLREKKVTHIVLAGFLWLVPGYLVDALL